MTDPPGRPLRLLEQVELCCRRRHFSKRTAEAYRYWVRRLVLFHGKRHPRELGRVEVVGFLDDLVEQRMASSTHGQALSAILFLYREVLEMPLPWLDTLARPKRTTRVPVVLGREEVERVLTAMQGMTGLMARLIYGSGMRLGECMTLRVKDLVFDRRTIVIRSGKGGKDRLTILPARLETALREQIRRVAALHRSGLALDTGWAPMPDRLARKYPGAARGLPWQFLFPADSNRWNPEFSRWERWHCSPTLLQRAFRQAVARVGLLQAASVHTLRHSFATHLLKSGVDIRTLQELLGHARLESTMLYTHVEQAMEDLRSPLDLLPSLDAVGALGALGRSARPRAALAPVAEAEGEAAGVRGT